MILFVALALMADPGVPLSTMPTLGQVPDRCVPKERRVKGTKPKTELRKLNEMPDAEPQFAVLREVDGCTIPAKVSAEARKRR